MKSNWCCSHRLSALAHAARRVSFTWATATLLAVWASFAPLGSQAQTFSQQEHSTGSGPISIAVADFNNDGLQDIAIALHDQRMVEIRLQQPDGTFSVGQQFATCGNPVKILTGDFFHSGHLDVATLNRKGTTCNQDSVDFMLGDGAGGVFYQDTESIPDGAVDMTVADVNGDGQSDVIVALSSKTIYTIRSGDIKSPDSKFFVSTSTPDTPGSQFQSITAGDFDHDGKIDIAVGTCCSGTDVQFGQIAVIKGAGDGTFGGNIATITPHNATLLRTIDINKDSIPDIASIEHNESANSVKVYVNDGSGHFSETTIWSFPDPDQFTEPNSMTVGDFNGDGLQDVAFLTTDQLDSSPTFGHSFLAVALQNSDHTFAAAKMFDLGKDKHSADVATLDIAGSSPLADLVAVNMASNTFTVLTNTSDGASCAAPASNGIEVCSPTSGSTVNSPVHVLASAKVAGAVYRFELWEGSTKLASVANRGTMDLNVSLPNGAHKLTFVARNADGSSRYTTSVAFTVGSGASCAPPTSNGIVVCTPADGSTVSSPVHVLAYAKVTGTIYRFELWNGSTKLASIPNSGTMNTSVALAPGSYSLTFAARNTAGTKITKTIHITVH